jgi:hypothetical protein
MLNYQRVLFEKLGDLAGKSPRNGKIVGKYIYGKLKSHWKIRGMFQVLLLLINGSLVKCGGECFSYTSEHALLKSQAKGSQRLQHETSEPSGWNKKTTATFGFTPSITSIRFPSAKHGPAIYKETRLKPQ